MNIPINEHAPVKSSGSKEIVASIDTVWGILTDIKHWPDWQKAVTETRLHGEIAEGMRFDWKAGGVSFKSELHTVIPKSRFGWTGSTLGTRAIHNWMFEDKAGKTIVSVEESLQGFLPNLFTKFFQKNLDAGIQTSLEELRVAAEKKSVAG